MGDLYGGSHQWKARRNWPRQPGKGEWWREHDLLLSVPILAIDEAPRQAPPLPIVTLPLLLRPSAPGGRRGRRRRRKSG